METQKPSWTLVFEHTARVQSLSYVQLLRPHGLQPTKLLCPWNFPDNTGVGCHFLFWGRFPTQGSNPCLLHWQADFFFFFFKPLSHLGSPLNILLWPRCRHQSTSQCYFWSHLEETLQDPAWEGLAAISSVGLLRNTQKKVSLQSTCQAEINTSCPATYGSYRINKADPLVYTEKLTQQNIHCKSNVGDFQIATK